MMYSFFPDNLYLPDTLPDLEIISLILFFFLFIHYTLIVLPVESKKGFL